MKRYLVTFLLLLTVLGWMAPAAAAQEEPATPVQPLLIRTDYPSQTVGAGEAITLELIIEASEPRRVDLEIQEEPADWEAVFRGKNHPVQAVFATPDEGGKVELKVEIPAGTSAGTYQLMAVARSGRFVSELPLTFVVEEKPPASLAFTADLPVLRGKPDSTFRFNVTLTNDGSDDLTVDLTADTPTGFLTLFKSGGQEVTSLPVAAGGKERLTVEVDPLFDLLPAEKYPVTIFARGGELQASLDLTAEIVGESRLTLTTPTGRLSGDVTAGQESTVTLVIANAGSAPARNISRSASQPAGGAVIFEPESVQEVGPGEQVEVTTRITPNDKALAGDYMLTLRANPEDSTNKAIDYRATVRTSTLWGVAGVALIAIAVLVVGAAVLRFGRR